MSNRILFSSIILARLLILLARLREVYEFNPFCWLFTDPNIGLPDYGLLDLEALAVLLFLLRILAFPSPAYPTLRDGLRSI